LLKVFSEIPSNAAYSLCVPASLIPLRISWINSSCVNIVSLDLF